MRITAKAADGTDILIGPGEKRRGVYFTRCAAIALAPYPAGWPPPPLSGGPLKSLAVVQASPDPSPIATRRQPQRERTSNG